MPYEYITHENGFTEIIAVNLTPAEEFDPPTQGEKHDLTSPN